MKSVLDDLNEAQKLAVTTTEGFVRVIAGAGSGKTRALTRRFAYLVNELGILPGNILCVTFTNKAANEMRRRIQNLTGDNSTGYINTFHGFCVSVLQEDISAIGYPKSFLVLDNSDIDAMLRIIYEERGLSLRDMTFARARDMFEMQKLFKKPDYFQDMLALPLDALKEKYMNATDVKDILFYGYLYQEKKCFALDYNDLLIFTLHIFSENPEIRLKWQKRLEYIMIDEFQDIDEIQYKLMRVLCDYHRNLFVVGDPDQTIYTWRGANIKYILDFDKEFPGTITIQMLQNYRSTPQITSVANSLIEKNRNRAKKELVSMQSDGKPVLCSHCMNQDKEAEWLADTIGEMHKQGVPYKDISILYRAHYITRSIEEVFLRRELPYTIYSGVQFFDRMEIKDALSYLRMVAYKDDLAFARICNTPKRNLGERRMQFLKDYSESHSCSLYNALTDNLDEPIFKGTGAGSFFTLIEKYSKIYAEMPVSELLSAILDESGYERMMRTEGGQTRLDNLAELKQSIHDFEVSCGEETGLEFYLCHVAMFSNSDADDGRDRVKMMTVHAAKGLEFPYVFLCGMNEGMFPSGKVRTLPEMEEERRLAFVAVTRAEKGLFLSDSEGRNLDNTPRYPSRFILDIAPELLEYTEEPGEGLIAEARDYIDLSTKLLPEGSDDVFFPEGTRVRHEIMGTGTVTEIDREKKAHIVLFDGFATPRSISVRAKLEAIEIE